MQVISQPRFHDDHVERSTGSVSIVDSRREHLESFDAPPCELEKYRSKTLPCTMPSGMLFPSRVPQKHLRHSHPDRRNSSSNPLPSSSLAARPSRAETNHVVHSHPTPPYRLPPPHSDVMSCCQSPARRAGFSPSAASHPRGSGPFAPLAPPASID